ncbi:hypothetical protein, partial [uncultured Mobiluncus sp.]|uniref:hypothetical protein n=1 Tax=uncultured Mobiluncus sp. TaxID=293425 RepID=UPI00262C316F
PYKKRNKTWDTSKQTHNLSFNPRVSRRENGEGGIKAMPSGHCATETPNRKTAATQSHEPLSKTVLIPNFYT